MSVLPPGVMIAENGMVFLFERSVPEQCTYENGVLVSYKPGYKIWKVGTCASVKPRPLPHLDFSPHDDAIRRRAQ